MTSPEINVRADKLKARQRNFKGLVIAGTNHSLLFYWTRLLESIP